MNDDDITIELLPEEEWERKPSEQEIIEKINEIARYINRKEYRSRKEKEEEEDEWTKTNI